MSKILLQEEDVLMASRWNECSVSLMYISSFTFGVVSKTDSG